MSWNRNQSSGLVLTLPYKKSPLIIQEFYRKCFLAHESLTNQIDWAQAEANQSRERAFFEASMNGLDDVQGLTMEEQALGALFEAHSALGEALKQHDDMERMAVDDMEMREARERSKKETKMDRNVSGSKGVRFTLTCRVTNRRICLLQISTPADLLPDHHRLSAMLGYPLRTTATSPPLNPSITRLCRSHDRIKRTADQELLPLINSLPA